MHILKNKIVMIISRVLVGLLTGALLLLLILNWIVMGTVSDRIIDVDNAAALEEEFDCILILGAGVKADGTPSSMLEDRLEIGIELYFAGASDRMLMSGDHMQVDYNEVGVMKRHAIEAGVPGNVIFLDHAGLSTYESLWRAKELYGVENVLIVTQEYHLYRALYVAEQLGMQAYGISADLRPYRGQSVRAVREFAARAKDFVFAHMKPQPTYLGDPVDLAGDGDMTNENPLFKQ